jgi:hypothetical protein
MKNIALKQIHFNGITMQIPEVWKYETEEYQEEDGTKSYSMSIYGKGKDVRSIDINWGIIPEGSDAYNEACATYIEVIGEDGLDENDEPILCFEFQGKEAHGFNVFTEDGLPCFFFCIDLPSKGKNHLLTVLVSAANDDDLHSMVEFVDEYLKVE